MQGQPEDNLLRKCARYGYYIWSLPLTKVLCIAVIKGYVGSYWVNQRGQCAYKCPLTRKTPDNCWVKAHAGALSWSVRGQFADKCHIMDMKIGKTLLTPSDPNIYIANDASELNSVL